MVSAHFLIGLAALIGGVYGLAMGRLSAGMGRAVFKTACVGLLAIAAGLEAGSYWLPVALALCALGDFLLAFDGERSFLGGLVAFLLGHLAYVVLFWQVGGGEADIGAIGYGIVALVTLGVIWMSAKLWPHTGAMRLPVLAYTLVIAAMVVSAEAFIGSWLVRVGVLAFMVSDMVLARERFLPVRGAGEVKAAPYLVWYLYAGGQVLITLGMLGAAGM